MTFQPTFFKPSDTPCDLLVTDETKARLISGGTFFRSLDTGKVANNIYIRGSLVQATISTQYYVLTVVQKDPNTFLDLVTESFNVLYENSPDLPTISPPGPPQFPTILPTPSPSITKLRVKVSEGSQLIEMPSPGQDYLYPDIIDSNHLSLIPLTPLRGGNGAPIPPDPEFFQIRTGPDRLLTFIVRRDFGTTLATVNEIQEWDGTKWVPYDRISS